MREMKKCTTCGQEKPTSEFYYANKKRSTTRSECKVCTKKKNRNYSRKGTKEYDDWFKKIPKKCERCGETRPYLIDFHHINPLFKTNGIAFIRTRDWSGKKRIELAKKEMAKCIQLCANCHREFHYLEKTAQIDLTEYI